MGSGLVKGGRTKDARDPKHDGIKTLIDIISEVPLFHRLPKSKKKVLAANLEFKDFPDGSVIIRQGDVGHEMFINLGGQCSVLVQGVDSRQPPELVATLGKGAFFGERALIKNVLRTATIMAVGGPVLTARISRDKFDRLNMKDLLLSYKRRRVGLGNRSIVVKKPTSKTKEERALIMEALYQNTYLNKIFNLTENQANSLIDTAWNEDVLVGTKIIEEGDPLADYFYIVQSGQFSLEKRENVLVDCVNADKVASPITSGTLGPGGSFGELALLCVMPRAATICALEDSRVWVVDRQSFRNVLLGASEENIGKRLSYLRGIKNIDALATLEEEALRSIATAMTEVYFEEGERVMTQGCVGVAMMYILIEGKVDVIKDGEMLASLEYDSECTNNNPVYFGELTLVNDRPRAATVVVVSSFARCLALDQSTVDLIVGSLETKAKFLYPKVDRGNSMLIITHSSLPSESQTEMETVGSVTPAATPHHTQIWSRANFDSEKALQDLFLRPIPNKVRSLERIVLDDLDRLGMLGNGSFGCVELCQHKRTKANYALKVLSKGFVVHSRMQKQVWIERDVLLIVHSPFIIGLYETYTDAQNMFFLLELASGGDLMVVYDKCGFHGIESHAKFYSAGVGFALAHLHRYRVMHRDLKPENILLNASGQVKLTDFGLAKQCLGLAFTACGTPEYFAPEILASAGYTLAVDWWSFGILVYELMLGYSPFEAQSVCETFALIVNGIAGRLPNSLKKPLKDLLKGLLTSEPSQRLPMRDGGLHNVQKQKWFQGFNWEDCFHQKLLAPYEPPRREGRDILEHFNVESEERPVHFEYVDDGSGWDSSFATCNC